MGFRVCIGRKGKSNWEDKEHDVDTGFLGCVKVCRRGTSGPLLRRLKGSWLIQTPIWLWGLYLALFGIGNTLTKSKEPPCVLVYLKP